MTLHARCDGKIPALASRESRIADGLYRVTRGEAMADSVATRE